MTKEKLITEQITSSLPNNTRLEGKFHFESSAGFLQSKEFTITDRQDQPHDLTGYKLSFYQDKDDLFMHITDPDDNQITIQIDAKQTPHIYSTFSKPLNLIPPAR